MDAAISTWTVVISTALAVDVVLVKKDLRSLTTCAQEHPVITTAAFLLLIGHFTKRLGRFDPFYFLTQAHDLSL